MAIRYGLRAFWRDATAAGRARWPLWLPVALGAGCALYFALPAEPDAAWGWAGLGLAVVLGAGGGWRRSALLALAAALALGFAAAKGREQAVAAPILERQVITHMVARIAAIETADAGARLILSSPISGGLGPGEIPARLRISLRGGADGFTPGQWISLTAGLSPPAPPAMPGAADFARAAYFQSAGAAGFSFGAPLPAMAPRPPTWSERISDGVAALRWRMTQRIRAALPGSSGGVAAALITGMRGGIAEEDEAALRDAGLAHVLAIAGLHMALMGMGLFWLLRAMLAAFPSVALRYPIKKWAAAAALAGAAFYLVISGAAAPAVRAFVMLAVGLVAVLLDRPALSMRGLALAAAILLLWRPESITEPGFQMSFAAVAALVAAAEASRAHGRGLWGHLNAIFVTSAVASLATLPFSIFHFGQATHYAVLGNLIAMPVMGLVVMPLATLSVAAMPFGLEAWPLALLGRGIELMLAMGRLVSGLPGAVTPSAAMPLATLVLISLGGLWLALWRGGARWLGLIPVAAGMLVMGLARPPDLLIAPDAATAALRDADGRLQLLARPADRRAARDWLRRDGDAREPAQAIGGEGIRCDALGCVAPTRAGLLALSHRPEALAEDCARAALLVSASAADCRGPRFVADGPRAAHAQGYALWFTPGLRIESVREWRGMRPWVR